MYSVKTWLPGGMAKCGNGTGMRQMWDGNQQMWDGNETDVGWE